jgi:hypothetical protein
VQNRIIVIAGRKDGFAEQHSLFILQTNPYQKPHIERFNDTIFENTTSDILQSIFFLQPSFENAEGKLSKRNVVTIKESLSFQRTIRKSRSVTNDDTIVINFIYDSVMSLDALSADRNISDIRSFFRSIGNRTFLLYSGTIKTDISNNVLFDFVLSDMNIEQWQIDRVQEIKQLSDGNWAIIGLSKVPFFVLSCF